ncbi:MAG: hypothetical protein AB1767_01840 [Bacillota bacterium]
MDDQNLDMDSLRTLLTNVLKQMDQSSLEEIITLLDQGHLQDLVLEAIGVAKQRLSTQEQERFAAVMQYVFDSTRTET